MKRLLFLGGSLYQVFAIKKAVEMGYYVITCDYLPNNPGHKYAHEYHNVSTTDKEGVLKLAQELKVEGIVAYASDPAAPVAAYVSEKLGLPTSPFNAVEILSKKDKFRQFLSEHGFNVPRAKSYSSFQEALKDINIFKFPVMVKPVDSSGSKGINKLDNDADLEKFCQEALSYSRDKRFIIEEFIEKKGCQISGDVFSVDGKLIFWSFASEFYSSKGIKDFVPLGESWPLTQPRLIEEKLIVDLQRLISELGMKSSAYNVEAVVDKDDNVYIMEMGARSGGSLIPQIIELATGVDMVPYVIKAAAGEDCTDMKLSEPRGCWSNYMLHSTKSGVFERFDFEKDFEKNNLVSVVTSIERGDKVNAFQNAGDALGTLIIKYQSEGEMYDIIQNMDKYVKVIVL